MPLKKILDMPLLGSDLMRKYTFLLNTRDPRKIVSIEIGASSIQQYIIQIQDIL